MGQEILIDDIRLVECLSGDSYITLTNIYNNATKKQKQLIDDLAISAECLIVWVSLLKAEKSLPYRLNHSPKYICGSSQMGAKISILCNDPPRQRYMGQWLDHKSLILSGRKYVKFVKLSVGASFFFNYVYKKNEIPVIKVT